MQEEELESLLTKTIKIVWADDGRDKCVTGTLVNITESFLIVETTNENQFYISKERIVCVKKWRD